VRFLLDACLETVRTTGTARVREICGVARRDGTTTLGRKAACAMASGETTRGGQGNDLVRSDLTLVKLCVATICGCVMSSKINLKLAATVPQQVTSFMLVTSSCR
jgi:hypothetical protein